MTPPNQPPTGSLVITLDSGGSWSSPDENGDKSYTGTVTVATKGGIGTLQVQGATVTVDPGTGEIEFSGQEHAYSLVGDLSAPLVTGPFAINDTTGEAVGLPPQKIFLASLPLTVTGLELDPDHITLAYDLPLVGPFSAVNISSSFDSHALIISGSGLQLGTAGDIQLGNIPNIDFGLFTANLSDLTLSVAPDGSELRLNGSLTLACGFGSSSLTLDFDSPSYIAISDVGGVPSVQFVGPLDAATTVSLPSAWGLEQISLDVNLANNTISGQANLSIPTLGTVQAALDFTTNPLALSAINVDYTFPDPGVPIGDTGLFLDSVGGGVNNIGPNAHGPIELSGTLGFSVLPNNPIFVPASFDATGTFIPGQPFEAAVKGTLVDFDNKSLGIFSGNGTLGLDPFALTVNGSLSFLDNAFDGNAQLTINRTGIYLTGEGSVEVPEPFSFELGDRRDQQHNHRRKWQ